MRWECSVAAACRTPPHQALPRCTTHPPSPPNPPCPTCSYPKMALLAALAADQLGPKRWRRRWTTPSRALRPVSDVPPEALAYLQV